MSAYERLYYKRKAQGDCVYCGLVKVTTHVGCTSCRELRYKMQKRRKMRKVCTRCKKSVDLGATLCTECKDQQNAVQRIKYKLRRKNNICLRCHKQTQGKTYCVDCNKMRLILRGKLDKQAKQAGKCVRCHKNKVEKRRSQCEPCLIKIRLDNKKRHERKVQNGICTDCSAMALPGKRCCAKHANKRKVTKN